MRILVRQFLARSLRPNHKRVHRPLHVRFALQSSLHMRGDVHQRPLVPLQHLSYRFSDTCWETFILQTALRLLRNNSGMAYSIVVVAPFRRAWTLRTRPTLGHGTFSACRTGRTVCLLCHSWQIKQMFWWTCVWDSSGTTPSASMLTRNPISLLYKVAHQTCHSFRNASPQPDRVWTVYFLFSTLTLCRTNISPPTGFSTETLLSMRKHRK